VLAESPAAESYMRHDSSKTRGNFRNADYQRLALSQKSNHIREVLKLLSRVVGSSPEGKVVQPSDLN